MKKNKRILELIKEAFSDDTDALSIMRICVFIIVISAVFFTWWAFLGEKLAILPYVINFDEIALGTVLAKMGQSFSENMTPQLIPQQISVPIQNQIQQTKQVQEIQVNNALPQKIEVPKF
jgi:hypothetical protein